MSVHNIVDHRSHPYCVDIKAIFEACWHDNCCDHATQFEEVEMFYREVAKTTVYEALQMAKSFPCPVTLYMYDV